MSIYINKGNEGFRCALNGEYVDKTGMIEVINKTLDTERSFTCVTVKYVQRQVMKELREVYPDIKGEEDDDLMELLIRIKQYTGEKFIVLIDEWDAICREFSGNPAVMDEYVKLLRRLFKGGKSKDVFAGAYLTGILPIKKYNTQSALNNVREYSVVEPGKLDKYFGFTPKEISDLVKDEEVSEDDLKAWYDGYSIGKEHSMYNPYSVMEAIERGKCGSFWSSTSAYDSVSTYIEMNYDGLKDDIIYLLAGGRCSVDTTGFSNDMHDIRSKDDVFTVLIHLGYLSYDEEEQECYIPNKEVRMEMVNAVSNCKWHVAKALEDCRPCLHSSPQCR